MSKEIKPFTPKELDKHKKQFGVPKKAAPRPTEYGGQKWTLKPGRGK